MLTWIPEKRNFIDSNMEKVISLEKITFFVSLLTVLRPAQEFFTYMETSAFPVMGCNI
jgi:hypothetical protein